MSFSDKRGSPLQRRQYFSIFCLITILVLCGCSPRNLHNLNNNQIQNPPELKVSVGEETIDAVLGNYSWSYHDKYESWTTGVEYPEPLELVKFQPVVVEVTQDTEVQLNFDLEPSGYEVRIWDEEGNLLDIDTEVKIEEWEGTIVVEIIADFAQGSASYVFKLHVKSDID